MTRIRSARIRGLTGVPLRSTEACSEAAPSGRVTSSSRRRVVNCSTARSCRAAEADLVRQVWNQARSTTKGASPLSPCNLRTISAASCAAANSRVRGEAAWLSPPSTMVQGPEAISICCSAPMVPRTLLPTSSASSGMTNGTWSGRPSAAFRIKGGNAVSGHDFARADAGLRQGHAQTERLHAVVGFFVQQDGDEDLVFVVQREPALGTRAGAGTSSRK